MAERDRTRTTVGAVELTVADLPRSLEYYRTTVGLDLLEEGPGQASLGAGGRELLVLVEEPGARPGAGYTGLYHFALLVPERHDSPRGSPMRPATASRSSGCRTTSSARRSTSRSGRPRDRDLLRPSARRTGRDRSASG